MVHIERFILPYPNLISVEGLGTLPEHCRSFGRLLGQLPIFRRDCSSPWQFERATSRNARSFCLRRLIVHCGALSSSCPPRTHDVCVVDTSLIYHSHLSPTLCQLLRGSRTVFSLPDTFRRLLPLRIISGSLALWSLLGIGCIAGPHSFSFRLWSLYSPLASSESEF